jgi:hypothetical protein
MVLASPSAVAQTRTQTFEFENGYGQRVICTETKAGAKVARTVTTFSVGGVERSTDVPPAAWSASGCKALLDQKSRPVSREEMTARLNAQLEGMQRGLDYERDIKPRIDRLQRCSDQANYDTQECQDLRAGKPVR